MIVVRFIIVEQPGFRLRVHLRIQPALSLPEALQVLNFKKNL